jgi:hypothetical protein
LPLSGEPCPQAYHEMAVAQQFPLTRERGTERWPSLQRAPPGSTGSGANTDCERKYLNRLLAEPAGCAEDFVKYPPYT